MFSTACVATCLFDQLQPKHPTMHPTIQHLLESNLPVITDGAWGTQLQARGLKPGACPDAWNLDQPDHVKAVAQSYIAAGSQIILTNTFGANRISLRQHGLQDKVAAINQAGAALSREAALSTGAKVFASMGPTGEMLAMGDVSEEEIEEAFREQAMALAEGGADGLVIETMADLLEAQLAVRAALTTSLPVVACMVFDTGADKDRTMMGVTPEQAVAGLKEAGATVVGANCGNGIEAFLPVIRRMADVADGTPLWAKGNAGLPELVDGKTVWRTTPQEFAHHAAALVPAGARFVGGCCGTSPAFIEALRQELARSK